MSWCFKDQQLISLCPTPEEHKEEVEEFGLMFFLLQLSVAYFRFFKFLMAGELSDHASSRVLKITPETNEHYSIPHPFSGTALL